MKAQFTACPFLSGAKGTKAVKNCGVTLMTTGATGVEPHLVMQLIQGRTMGAAVNPNEEILTFKNHPYLFVF